MWIFFTLVGLGLAFMLYALVQFHGDTKGRRSRERRGTDAKSDIAGGGRLLHIRSTQAVVTIPVRRVPKDGVMVIGRFRFTALALLAMCLFAGFARARNQN